MTKTFSLLIAVIAFSFVSLTASEDSTWMHNFDDAKAKAKTEKKLVLMSFSGSDWCGNCMRLEQDLFETEAFKAFGTENFVLLNLDFPAKKKNQLPAEQKKQNEALAAKYNKEGAFPLVIILDADGKVIGKMSHPKRSTEDYIANLKKLKNLAQ